LRAKILPTRYDDAPEVPPSSALSPFDVDDATRALMRADIDASRYRQPTLLFRCSRC